LHDRTQLDLPVFGYCLLSRDPELQNMTYNAANLPGKLVMTGNPVSNRHFFQVCGRYCRKKGA
jgi:hypothetical protein